MNLITLPIDIYRKITSFCNIETTISLIEIIKCTRLCRNMLCKEKYLESFHNKALIMSCKHNSLNICKELIKCSKININDKDHGETGLVYAIKYGNLRIVEELLKCKNINLSVKCLNGDTALIYVINLNLYTVNNRIEIFKALLQHPKTDVNIQNEYGQTALMYSCIYNRTEILKILLQHSKIDINIRNKYAETALIYSIRMNKLEIIKELKKY